MRALDHSGGSHVILRLAEDLMANGNAVSLCVSATPDSSVTTDARVLHVSGRKPAPLAMRALQSICPPADILVATYYPTAYVAARLMKQRRGACNGFYFVQGRGRDFPEGMWKALKAGVADRSYGLPLEIITTSAWLAEHIRAVSGKAATLAGLGVDHHQFVPESMPLGWEDRMVITTIGRRQKLKRFELYLETLRQLKADGVPAFGRVVTQESLSLPDDLEGEIVSPKDQKEYAACLRDSNVYLSTSESEGFCLPGLEAMASGCLFVSTDSGGVRAYAEHEVNALISGNATADELAALIRKLWGNPSLRESLRAAGRATSAGKAGRTSVSSFQTPWASRNPL